MDEIWKDIDGFDGLYQISNYGRVKSLTRLKIYENRYGGVTKIKLPERILKCTKNNKGYCMITLYKNGNSSHKLIHRLVAKAFIPNSNNLPEVNHKDENKLNNEVSNLMWCTRQYNNNYGIQDKEGRRLTAGWRMKKVVQYSKDGELINVYDGIRLAEEKTGINNQNICKCCKGKMKTAGGYVWRYADEQF